ncbi:Metallo-hydrolase/oxidoreductase [Rhizodiscina lignyota]|uniref:Metallo-hydrolase/oxidoreductase n=1 Tax=Rhizodiscina lignyota TaxID=1504668 RepID=A0A9P4I8U4_9PEZI|nr:Metallo-hydrolase/oxidoreductase [Rhizodiscina lignyota]
MKHLTLDPNNPQPPTRKHLHPPTSLVGAKETKVHPKGSDGSEDAQLMFIGNATTILSWQGIRLLTDPNFLHAGDHVHLGPGVSGVRLKDPAIDLHDLPHIDLVLLSHYHGDHFDQIVEDELRRDLPIITTPHAKSCLTAPTKKGEDEFTAVTDLDFFDSCFIDIKDGAAEGNKQLSIKVTGMPGKHVPPGPVDKANDLLHAVPPTNGWMLELGYIPSGQGEDSFQSGYRIYISGDTLFVDELKEIPERYKNKGIDLMLIHLGGTTLPGPKMPLLMVTMDAKQGIELVRLISPDLTIPIHFDDYDVFLSPLSDFKKVMEDAGLSDKVLYLDRRDEFKFRVK